MHAFSSHQTSYINQVEAYVARMPSLSTTATKVLETCSNPQASPNDLNRLISLDPVLTGQVLRLINSAFYSLSHPVSSLTALYFLRGFQVDAVICDFAADGFKGILDPIRSAKFNTYLPDFQIGSSGFKSLRDVDNQVGCSLMIRHPENSSQVFIFGIDEAQFEEGFLADEGAQQFRDGTAGNDFKIGHGFLLHARL